MKINFYLKYYTVFGEQLFISGNNILLGDDDSFLAAQMQWLNEDYWRLTIDLPNDFDGTIYYRYI